MRSLSQRQHQRQHDDTHQHIIHNNNVRRNLQAFVIYDPITNKNYTSGGANGGDDDGNGDNDGSNSSSSGGTTNINQRPSTIIACAHVPKDTKAIKTIVYVQYTVDMDQHNITVPVYEKEIPTYVGGAMIDLLEGPLCGTSSSSSSTGTSTSTSTSTSTTGSTITSSNCTLSISTGSDDMFTRSCTPSSTRIPSSKSCFQYHGTIQVTHTDDCTPEEIRADTIAVLQDTIDTSTGSSSSSGAEGSSGSVVTGGAGGAGGSGGSGSAGGSGGSGGSGSAGGSGGSGGAGGSGGSDGSDGASGSDGAGGSDGTGGSGGGGSGGGGGGTTGSDGSGSATSSGGGGAFVASINDRRDAPKGDAVITAVTIIQNNSTLVGIANTADSSAMYSPGTIMTVILLGALGTIAWILLMLWLWYRKRQMEISRLNALRKDERLRKKQKALEDDLKSIRTDWSNANGNNGKNGRGDTSYVKPDPHNLALCHKTVDVHVCRSATCPICVNKDLGKVTMIPVRNIVDPLTTVTERRFGFSRNLNTISLLGNSTMSTGSKITNSTASTVLMTKKQRSPRSNFCKDDVDDEELTLATPVEYQLEEGSAAAVRNERTIQDDEKYDKNSAPLELHRVTSSSNNSSGRTTMNVIRSLSLFDRAEQQQKQQLNNTAPSPPGAIAGQQNSSNGGGDGTTVNSIVIQEQLQRLQSIDDNDSRQSYYTDDDDNNTNDYDESIAVDDPTNNTTNEQEEDNEPKRRNRWTWTKPAKTIR